MNTYLVTDTHFFHSKLSEWGDRPENFTELIVAHLKSMVQPEDIVIHLGDVIFGLDKEKNLIEIMKQLPGTYILIRGNHDLFETNFYLKCGFKMVCDQIVIDNILFSHIPIEKSTWPEKVKMNVHGHFHNNTHRHEEFPFYTDEPNYKLLALERTNLKPVLLEDFCGISFDTRLFSNKNGKNKKQ